MVIVCRIAGKGQDRTSTDTSNQVTESGPIKSEFIVNKNFGMFVLASASLLAGCGGGSSSTTAATPVPVPVPVPVVASVTGITSGTLMYGKLASLTVNGANLNLGITMTAPTCSTVVDTGGSATQHIFTCTPTATGTLTVAVQSTLGVTLASITAPVPVPQVTMTTSMGTLVLELYPANAPLTVNNFLQYVSANYYSNLIFHRVVPGFVVQGGGFNAALVAATTRAAIKLEASNGLSNVRGSVAMARTSVADSATSQFFINTVDNVALDTASGGYAVFGKVVTGLTTVVDKIAAVPTQSTSGFDNVPVTAITILSAQQTQ